jgi:hypothetical protein
MWMGERFPARRGSTVRYKRAAAGSGLFIALMKLRIL